MILLAEDPGIDGINFGINSTVYCTSSGVSCNPDLVGSRVFYPDQIKLQASNNLGVCYYSIDNGGNKENTKCGRILFDTPPAVLITSPVNLLVIGSDSIAVTGSHNAQSVNQSQIFISNGSLSRTLSIPRTANTFNQNVTLYDGKNIISVQVTNVAGVTGEETREVYYDKTGPEIIFSSSPLVEYGQSFDLQASISDEKWTTISSRDNVGQIKNSTKAIIQSVVSNLSVTVPLLRSGQIWKANIVPKRSPSGFYDYIPGMYFVSFIAEDIFGNAGSITSNLSIEDTVPSNFTIILDKFGSRDGNTFYVNHVSPEILVRTQDPAECEIRINSVVPSRTEKFVSSPDGLNHSFSSSSLAFARGLKQTFESVVLCRDLTSNSVKGDDYLKIIYDDISPQILLSGNNAKLQIEKDNPVYEIDLASQTLPFEIQANELRGDQVICDISCAKKGVQACGKIHSSILPALGSNQFESTKKLQIDYDREDNPFGEYSYDVLCRDRSNNTESEQIFVYVSSSEYKIIEKSPLGKINLTSQTLSVTTNYPSSYCRASPGGNMISQSPSNTDFTLSLGNLAHGTKMDYSVECERIASGEKTSALISFEVDLNYTAPSLIPAMPTTLTIVLLADLTAPVISNIDIVNSLDQTGVITTRQTDFAKSAKLIYGKDSQNQFFFKLVADTNELSLCRYSTLSQPFNLMPNNMGDKLSYYSESDFIKVQDNQAGLVYYISCVDSSQNEAGPYVVQISTNSKDPIILQDVKPGDYVNTQSIIVQARSHRDLTCSYSDGLRSDISMFSTFTNKGYLQSSARFPGQSISPGEGFHQFSLTCSLPQVAQLNQNVSFTIDSKVPSLLITDPRSSRSSTSNSFISFKGDLSETGAKVSFIVNGVLQKDIRVSGIKLDEKVYLENRGENKIAIIAEDRAGNKASQEFIVDAISSLPRVISVNPYRGSLPAKSVMAKLSGNNLDLSRSTIELSTIRGTSIRGSLRRDTSQQTIEFIPDSPLTEGDYYFEVIPKDNLGNIAYGLFSYFTVSNLGPRAEWEVPSSLDDVVTQRLESLSIVARSATSSTSGRVSRVITDASFKAGPSLDNLKEYSLFREGDRYKVDSSILPQGRIYTVAQFKDLGGQSEIIKILNVLTEGPVAKIIP